MLTDRLVPGTLAFLAISLLAEIVWVFLVAGPIAWPVVSFLSLGGVRALHAKSVLLEAAGEKPFR